MLGNDSKLDVFLRKGEINKAAQLAISVLKAVNNEKSDCGQALGQGLKTLVCAYVNAKLSIYHIKLTHWLRGIYSFTLR